MLREDIRVDNLTLRSTVFTDLISVNQFVVSSKSIFMLFNLINARKKQNKFGAVGWFIKKDFLYSNGRNFYSKIFNGLRTPPSSVN